jgi:hypothetical protein
MAPRDDSRRSSKVFSTSNLPFTISPRHLSWRPTRLGLIAGVYAARFLNTAAVTADDVRRTYRLFCSKLARVGLVRTPGQGPLDFAAVVNAARQDLKGRVATIVALYIRLRYDRRGGNEDLKRFKLAVRQFKP